MFCPNCGKEISNKDAVFCANCGTSIKTDAINQLNPDSIIATNSNTGTKNSKMKRILLILGLILAGIVIFCYKQIRDANIEKSIVKASVENYMDIIQQGLDDATMEEIVFSLLYSVTDNEDVINFVTTNIKGEDVNDVYSAIMQGMAYSVADVERIKFGEHYRIRLRINNVDNIMVGKEAIDLFISRYQGGGLLDKAIQIYQDVTSDKSQLIADLICEARAMLYEEKGNQIFFTKDFTFDVINTEDGWEPIFINEEDLNRLLLTCAGIPVK